MNSRDSELSQLLMAVLFTATSLSIFFVSLDHYKKTKQDKKAKRSFFVMVGVALFFLVLASIEAIPLL
ncbi:hypothetical protein JCM19046_2776 [Bacillus sp. JCM 19046]|nr:hypothetical protein JCM19045_1579 [Bacillus sp. JCM 19045]GAF18215.1 hypothetical protein JCM19046_2776 [Bacillus sp. JCM 19046]